MSGKRPGVRGGEAPACRVTILLWAIPSSDITESLVKNAGDSDRISIWTANIPQATKNLTRGFRSPKSSEVRSALADLAAELPLLRLAELSYSISAQSPAPYAARAISSADIAEIIYTSGTTAEPKGVVLTHRNLLANLAPLEREIQKYLKWERLVHPLRLLNLVPLSHVFGQFMSIFVPQLLGAEVFLQADLRPRELLRAVRRQRINCIVAVPRLLDTLRETIEREWATRGKTSAVGRHAQANSTG